VFELTEEERMIRDTARKYARETLSTRAKECDKAERFPVENFIELGELGFMGIYIPEQYGGSGLGSFAAALIIEELARVCPATAVTLGVHNSLCTGPIIKFGTEAQKKKYLPAMASGKSIGAYGLTEPNYGSDAANLKTSAELKGGKYILNGTKAWISSGSVAGVLLVFARSERNVEKPAQGVSAFLIEPSFKGFSVGKVEKKMGIRASNTTELVFDNCEVPKENLLGKPGQGFKIAMEFLDAGRIGVAAQALGIGRACLDEAVKYSKERKQFGKSISEFQAVQVKLADMAMELEAARLLVYRAARLRDAGKPHSKEASMAKLFASEMCNRAAAEALQIHGGYGYTKDYPVERFFRDAKITEIYEGTSEIQRIVIARHVLSGNLGD
jgi:alkylation response protein AidB-like acyl-CoA dehydrogenase